MGRLTCMKPRVGNAPRDRFAVAGAVVGHERGATGYAWQQIRKRILARDCGMCVLCFARGLFVLAAEVDHREPVWRGGTDADNNLQSLCRRCHRVKSAREATERSST